MLMKPSERKTYKERTVLWFRVWGNKLLKNKEKQKIVKCVKIGDYVRILLNEMDWVKVHRRKGNCMNEELEMTKVHYVLH